MRMPPACLPARHIIQIINPPNIKWNGYSICHNGNITFGIVVIVQMNNCTIVNRTIFHGGKF